MVYKSNVARPLALLVFLGIIASILGQSGCDQLQNIPPAIQCIEYVPSSLLSVSCTDPLSSDCSLTDLLEGLPPFNNLTLVGLSNFPRTLSTERLTSIKIVWDSWIPQPFPSTSPLPGRSIPTELGQFIDLTSLTINGFNLGSIPTQIGRLHSLQTLIINRFDILYDSNSKDQQNCWTSQTKLQNLSYVSGLIPNLSGLSQLQSLQIICQNISGTLPNWIGELPLQKLVLQGLSGKGLSGNIPTQIGKMQNLEYLSLRTGAFDVIPTELGLLSLLAYLDLGSNDIQSIPLQIGNLTLLNTLKLDLNYISEVPQQIFHLPNLQSLMLAVNDIESVFSLDQMAQIQTIDLSSNFLTAFPFSSLQELPRLTELSLSGNKIGASFDSFSAFLPTSLQILSLDGNLLSGTAPTNFCQLTSLTYLSLQNTKLSGALPECLSALQLQVLLLSGTYVNGGCFPFQTPIWRRCETAPSQFYCGPGCINARSVCQNTHCYTESNPCLNGSHKCLDPAVCIPDENHWYSCSCDGSGFPKLNFTSCDVSAMPLQYILAISLGIPGFIFLIFIAIAFYLMVRRLSYVDLSSLPRKPREIYEHFHRRPEKWTKEVQEGFAPFWWLYLSPGSTKWKNMEALFHKLGGSELKIEKAFAVYNKTLLQNFINARKIMADRFESSPDIFSTQKWRKERDEALVASRAYVADRYKEKVEAFEWNKSTGKHSTVPILPVLHGTDLEIAKSICATGFASLSSVDEGYYGKGIYFTSFAMYALTYVVSRLQPTMIISYVTLGNVFPVIENHKSQVSFLGKPIKNGYNSHYVLTKRNGHVVDSFAHVEVYDEIVVPQESQICPVYILVLATKEIMAIVDRWQRTTPIPRKKIRVESDEPNVDEESLFTLDESFYS